MMPFALLSALPSALAVKTVSMISLAVIVQNDPARAYSPELNIFKCHSEKLETLKHHLARPASVISGSAK